jgi:hypothetical protein
LKVKTVAQAARVAILGDSRRRTHPMETLEARRRLLQPPSALDRKRLPGESYEAYRAFCIYRDLGPGRSLNKAWRHERAERGKGCPQARCPGRWRLWAREWRWVERTASILDKNSFSVIHTKIVFHEGFQRGFGFGDHSAALRSIKILPRSFNLFKMLAASRMMSSAFAAASSSSGSGKGRFRLSY